MLRHLNITKRSFHEITLATLRKELSMRDKLRENQPLAGFSNIQFDKTVGREAQIQQILDLHLKRLDGIHLGDQYAVNPFIVFGGGLGYFLALILLFTL